MARPDPQGLAVLVFLAFHHAASFQPNFGDSVTHSAITQKAALQILLRVFQKIPSLDGNVIPSDAFRSEELTAEKLFERFYGTPTSVLHFQNAVKVMTSSNTMVDFIHATEGRYHFDSETLAEGKNLLLRTKSRAIKNILRHNYNKALKNVGSLLHTLQDFYSHSNWIELGFQKPHSSLLKFGESFGRIAGPDEETCTECSTSHGCKDNILEKVLKEKILTTGYFGFTRNSRPKGKCSHGGTVDRGKRGSQGINKDKRNSPHGQYHTAAARVATEATVEVFQEIWDTVGDQAFLRFLNIRNPTGLAFVIDTTGSMRDDIEGAKQRTINIVKNRHRTQTKPSFYLLVPFNDPDFGPVFKTSDAEKFIEKLGSLRAVGGGDTPEMSLSALQLALTHTPPLSFIYVFTDAPAKDSSLKNTIVGLIEHTKCTVSFLLTNVLTRRRKRAADELGNQLYQDLAHKSGGLAVVTQKQEILELTSIIEDMAHPDMVTVLQRDSNQDYRDNVFTFPVDTTLRNVTIYISGRPAKFRLSRPGGTSQSSAISSGELAQMKRFGDLTVLYLHSPLVVGQWELFVSSGTPYRVKVTGQSVVNFLYDFVQPFQGPHPGFTLLPGRPMAGKESMMSVTVPGLAQYPGLGVQEVALVDTQGEVLLKEPLGNESSDGSYLVKFRTLPGRTFHIQLSGQHENNLGFKRQSPTLTTGTNTVVKVSVEPSVKVGSHGNISFTVSNSGAPVSYTIYVTDDHNLIQFKPQRMFLDRNESMEGTAVISVPEGTELGTVITLTLGAMSDNDLAYNIQEVTVISQDEDISPPSCTILQHSGCPMGGGGEHCSSWNWTLIAEIVENRRGEVTLFTRGRNGSVGQRQFTVSPGVVTHFNYTATCCYHYVALVAVDVSGNAGKCSYPSRTNSRATTHTLRPLSLLAVGLAMSWLPF